MQGQLTTWGKRCDGFIAFSNVDDPIIHALKLDNIEESYLGMWSKVQMIWQFVADMFIHSINDKGSSSSPGSLGSPGRQNSPDNSVYDWFLIGGDDLYVSVRNLRYNVQCTE